MGKKVFILNHGLANGGTDTFTINLSKGLKDRNYDVSVVMAVYPDSEPQPREHILKEAGIPIYKTSDLVGIKGVFDHSRRLYKILRQNKPDVFHANMDLFNGINMLVAWLARVPVRVCHSHNSQSQYEANTGKHTAVNLYRNCMRALCWKFANRYCGCSEVAMDYLFKNKWKGNNRAFVIHNGIDLSIFKNNNNQTLDNPTKKIVTVGRIAEQKNPEFIVNIIESLSVYRTEFKLIWIGTGELYENIKLTVSKKNLDKYICFMGNRNDIPDILQECHIFILPSLFEGLPISLIESQACGLYSLVSETVSREIDCGLCDFLSIEKSDIWAKHISNYFDYGTTKKIDNDLLNRFNINTMITKVEEAYNSKHK